MSDHGHTEHHPPEASPEFEIIETAMRELLIEKGVFSADDVNNQMEKDEQIRPENGARIVARFWSDPAFRERALADGKAAAAETGLDLNVAPDLVMLENTPQLQHVTVCTLCSCSPMFVIGPPPDWYKSTTYRKRVVRDPRGVLAEWNNVLPEDMEVRVVDVTTETRYLVIPLRPEGTEGWSEEELAKLVTRDSMFGVEQALRPGEAGR
ncbi:MAG: nitrile hydratase subunit alpha [SAR324 cluster bacterium]|nr:nitrile hydratase subunit alpha [SAR324 cluster bacterium]